MFAHLALVLIAGICLPRRWSLVPARRGAARMSALLATATIVGTRRLGHRGWPRPLAAGELTLLEPVGRAGRVAHGAARPGAAIARARRCDCPDGRYPVGRPRSTRRRSGWSAPCATCIGWSRSACPTRGRGSITATTPTALSVPAGGGRAPAPDPGRAGACRHHRAGPFPLHRRRRDGGAAGGAARLRAQGHRGADARRRRHRAPRGSPAASPATARSPTRSASPARWRRRSASRRRRAPSGCAR